MAVQFTDLARQLHRGIVRNFPRRQVYAPGVDNTWSCDLVDYSNLKKHNDGYAYMLVCVDVFSKSVRAVPLLNKTAKTVTLAFESLPVLPHKLWVDRGKEFYNREMERFCDNNNITMYSTYGESKSVIAERFNRTIKGWIALYMTMNNTLKWVDILPELIRQYNTRKHSTIKITPEEAREEKNFDRVYLAIWGGLPPKQDSIKARSLASKAKLKVGDNVRISRLKGVFEKGYHGNWSEEVFKVSSVNNTAPVTYNIVDMLNEPIEGSFYQQELQRVHGDPMENVRIEKVLKEDKRGKRIFVKWRGWPKKFNSWVSSDQITHL